MVLMRLIKADKRLAERIQKRLNFSNYQMLWLSTPLGKFMSSMSQQAKKVFPSSKTNRYTQRDWVDRLTSGAETRAEALLGFAESDENKALFSEMTGVF